MESTENVLLQRILKGQDDANLKLDQIKATADAMDKRVIALEYDKSTRDAGRTSREKWSLALSGAAIAAVVAMFSYALTLKTEVASLENDLATVKTYGTPYGAQKLQGIEERFGRYGDRDNSMEKRISALETVTNDMNSRIKP